MLHFVSPAKACLSEMQSSVAADSHKVALPLAGLAASNRQLQVISHSAKSDLQQKHC